MRWLIMSCLIRINTICYSVLDSTDSYLQQWMCPNLKTGESTAEIQGWKGKGTFSNWNIDMFLISMNTYVIGLITYRTCWVIIWTFVECMSLPAFLLCACYYLNFYCVHVLTWIYAVTCAVCMSLPEFLLSACHYLNFFCVHVITWIHALCMLIT